MPSLSTFVAPAVALAVLGLSGCKSVYSDTFSYKKNSFQPPVKTMDEIKAPTEAPHPLEGAVPGGVLPGMPDGIPGIPAPDGGIPGVPPAPAPAPAIPGLN
jgi:hypothetical protein